MAAKQEGVTTIAMESTGDYWQNLHAELESDRAGLEVILVNGKYSKNVKGKKTDVLRLFVATKDAFFRTY